jgi:hypothetical protein
MRQRFRVALVLVCGFALVLVAFYFVLPLIMLYAGFGVDEDLINIVFAKS